MFHWLGLTSTTEADVIGFIKYHAGAVAESVSCSQFTGMLGELTDVEDETLFVPERNWVGEAVG